MKYSEIIELKYPIHPLGRLVPGIFETQTKVSATSEDGVVQSVTTAATFAVM